MQHSIKKQILPFFFITLSLMLQLQPNRDIQIPTGTTQLVYSAQQKYLIASSPSQVSIYYGINGTHLADLDLQGDTGVSSIGVSPSNQMMAVGFQSGLVKLYDLNKGLTPQAIDPPKQSTVKSLCFTKDDQHLVSGFEDDLVTIYNIEEDEVSSMDFSQERVFSVACSSIDNGKFVVGGGQLTLAKFSLYKIVNNQTTELINFPDHQNMTVLASAFSENGKNIYRAGSDGKIYKYLMTSETEYEGPEIINVGSEGTLFGLVVSADESIVATVNDSAAFMLYVNKEQLTLVIESEPTTFKTVALSPKGLNLVVVGTDATANVFGQCNEKQFLNGDNCQPCIDACTLCQDANDNCFGCEDAFYLNEATKKCLTCGVGCLSCQQANNCVNCNDPGNFQPDGSGNCQCKPTYYLSVNECVLCERDIKFCISCTSGPECSQCSGNRDPSTDKKSCLCKPGYYEDSNQICQQCTLPHCNQCSAVDVCTKCDGSNNWIVNATNQCQCDDGFREQDDQCLQCPTGCDECDANNTCLKCSASKHFNPTPNDDGLCDCMKAYYFNNETDTCDACILGCSDCDNGETCIKCDEAAHFVLNSQGKCKCIQQTYFLNETQCVACSSAIKYCLTCDSATVCTKCVGDLTFKNEKCECQSHFFIENDKCVECLDECQTCLSEDQCLKCKDGYELDEGHCKSTGLDVLIIVLIVLGVVFLLAAIFVIIKCIKKKQSHQSYEQIQ